MTRAFLLVSFLILISIQSTGQCVNSPTVRLSLQSSSVCGPLAVTITGNTFGGSATKVTITENGSGTVSPGSASVSPFSFTYTPKNGDFGKQVIITVTTDNPLGVPCSAAVATFTLTVGDFPTAPLIGTITQPTCQPITGSVALSGLPANGLWTLRSVAGAISMTGSGTTAVVSGLPTGSYSFTVTNAEACISPASPVIVINNPPPAPPAPGIGSITQPTCTLSTGSINLSGLPSSGTWLLTRTPGGVQTQGTGGNTIITGLPPGSYTFIVTDSQGCTSNPSSNAVINTQPVSPTTPVIGTISQPTCTVSTGSVILSGLPSSGTWTLLRSPGNISVGGSGLTATVNNLPAGTFTFTVTNSAGCSSAATSAITISSQPDIPSKPVVGTITSPTCLSPLGSVVLSGLPLTGTWTMIRYPGTVSSSGTGGSTTISGIPSGQYNFTITNAAGCVSDLSSNVIIPSAPATPSTPVIGTITQPNVNSSTGSVILTGLPASGAWTLTMSPGNVNTAGTGITKTISGLSPGTYSFTVTNSVGCISAPSAGFTIKTPSGNPVLVINNPVPVCYPATVDLTSPDITKGSTPGLTYTFWTDANATIVYTAPVTSSQGTYFIKGTTADGFFTIKPVSVMIYKIPVANAGPDQLLSFKFETSLNAQLGNTYEKGTWSLISGSGFITDSTKTNTTVTGLSTGKNLFLWKVVNGVCPASFDTLLIKVNDRAIATLITPNMDGKNDYLILKGSNDGGRLELVIFDRRGVEVYKNRDYDNSWNGIDYNGNPLNDDTYFYVMKDETGKTRNGYIVVKR